MRTKTKLNWSIIDLGFRSRSTATTAAVQKKCAVSSLVLHGQQWLRVRQEVAGKQFFIPRSSTNLLETSCRGQVSFRRSISPTTTLANDCKLGRWLSDSYSCHIEQNDQGLEGDRWTARRRDCIPQAWLRGSRQPLAVYPHHRIWALLSMASNRRHLPGYEDGTGSFCRQGIPGAGRAHWPLAVAVLPWKRQRSREADRSRLERSVRFRVVDVSFSSLSNRARAD